MIQRTTKYYSAQASLLRSCANELSTLHKDNSIHMDAIIKKFLHDIEETTNASRNFTPERCAKISVSILNFYAQNKLLLSEPMQELIYGFKSILDKGVALEFLNAATTVSSILQQETKREFMDATVYFIDAQILDQLLVVRETLQSSYASPTDEKKYKFTKLVNILNESFCAKKYHVDYKSKFQQINKAESVEYYLPAHFEVWKNTENKNFNELLHKHEFDDGTKSKMFKEHEAKIKIATEEYQHLMNNLDTLDVRVLGYEDALMYPEIAFTADRKTVFRHLKSELANVLWFSPEPFKENMTVKEFIDNSHNPFGNVYYTPREE